MALVYNCYEDLVAAAFIGGSQVTRSFYKHLVKNDVIKMRDILVRAQMYMRIKEATQGTTNRPPYKGSRRETQATVPHEKDPEPQFCRGPQIAPTHA